MHIEKRTACCIVACERVSRNTETCTVALKADNYLTPIKLSHVCQESPVGIEEEAISLEITIACCIVKRKTTISATS